MNSHSAESDSALKQQVHQFWNEQSCDTQVAGASKFSREYFEEIERFRYFDQPFIHGFAQFSRYHGRRVLEVGTGAGTDFIQWLRAGAVTSGVDLTEESLRNVEARIRCYNLPRPERLEVADAESLPFSDAAFDLGYSFGVLHHTPNTPKALAELVRVIKPGGELKVMLYNRQSIFVINRWVRFALLRGKPWKSLGWILWHHNESLGTNGYTRSELQQMFAALPLQDIHVETFVMAGDWLSSSAFKPLNWLYRLSIAIVGCRYPWRPEHYTARINDRDAEEQQKIRRAASSSQRVVFSGNPLGFFHCISARKRS
jgi:ubiquinone/menaquinone biosynthesis C-methylase UbiE